MMVVRVMLLVMAVAMAMAIVVVMMMIIMMVVVVVVVMMMMMITGRQQWLVNNIRMLDVDEDVDGKDDNFVWTRAIW